MLQKEKIQRAKVSFEAKPKVIFRAGFAIGTTACLLGIKGA